MRISVGCFECAQEGFEKDKGKTVPYIPTHGYYDDPIIELDKWPYLEVVCDKGHKHRFLLQLELYELLFEQATFCIDDGYYREAIGTYHAALERYFEYVIEILWLNNDTASDFENLWKRIQKQSERQLGAYYLIWQTTFKENPIFIDENKIKLRNKVVHQGHLATKSEAEEYGEYVFNYIREAQNKISSYIGEKECLLQMSRCYRIAKIDIDKALRAPVVKNTDGKEMYEGIGSMSVPCFLSNTTTFVNYSDCFKMEKRIDYGLKK